jgi:hypothetical protein
VGDTFGEGMDQPEEAMGGLVFRGVVKAVGGERST